MILLTIRTDKPVAELGLFNDEDQIEYVTWQADRQLSVAIHQQLKHLLKKSKRSIDELEGIVGYKGPGSFTGLRIGLSVTNALAYSLDIPVVAKNGYDWQLKGIKSLKNRINDRIAVPLYGSAPRTTKPIK